SIPPLFLYPNITLLASFRPFSTDSALPRLADVAAAEAFIDSAEVVIIGFFKVRGSVCNSVCEFVCGMQEYNQASAVGLFQSEVKVHLLLFANRGSADYKPLQEKLAALAPHYTGKMLFVLINGKVKSNERALGYFNLKPGDLPRVGIYDADSDKTFLLPEGEISTERVQNFCDSFISGELQKEKESEENKKKSEL
uniref:Endoplasmic reticulum protein 27 n=1 Tax=Astyanax mexicanus TaxID=7994 RepID=W5KVZ1_ASTMX